MSRSEIIEKVVNKSREFPKTEESVVFLLSKIRKILEDDSYPEKYSVLNFYCNLALHSKIERPPKKYSENIKKLIEGEDFDNSFIKFNDFHSQLKVFFDDYGIHNFYLNQPLESKKIFEQLLIDTWSETPIRISVIDEYNIKVDKDGGMSFKHHTFTGFVKMIKGYIKDLKIKTRD